MGVQVERGGDSLMLRLLVTALLLFVQWLPELNPVILCSSVDTTNLRTRVTSGRQPAACASFKC